MSILVIQGLKQLGLAGVIILGFGAPVLAQGTENLSVGTDQGNEGGMANGMAVGLTDAIIQPAPGEVLSR